MKTLILTIAVLITSTNSIAQTLCPPATVTDNGNGALVLKMKGKEFSFSKDAPRNRHSKQVMECVAKGDWVVVSKPYARSLKLAKQKRSAEVKSEGWGLFLNYRDDLENTLANITAYRNLLRSDFQSAKATCQANTGGVCGSIEAISAFTIEWSPAP